MKFATLLLLLALSSCGRYNVAVHQKKIDATSLASFGAETPDPKLKHPPYGQMLAVEWQIPLDLLPKNPLVQLDVIFWDNIERHYVWPISHRKGYETLSIVNEEFERTGGVLTYRAKILTEDGKVFYEWRHRLWVNLITIDNGAPPPPRSKAVSPASPSMDQ